jgi:two-component sensor histidine kinase
MRLNRIYFELLNNRTRPVTGYVLAVVTTATAAVLRYVLNDVLPPGFPFLTFFPAVTLIAFFYGPKPGAVCAVLSGLTAWYYFIPPFATFELDAGTLLALFFFALSVGTILALFTIADQAFGQMRKQQEMAQDLAEQRRIMFQELQHRVANNLQFVASFLALQKRKVAARPEAAALVFDEARIRLEMMSSVHRRLYDPANTGLTMARHIEQLCEETLQGSGARNITVKVHADPIALPVERTMTLSLFIVELVTNAIKHAFAPTQAGHITVTLARQNNDEAVLSIEDDGRGMPDQPDQSESTSLGQRILQGFVSQLRGHFRYLPNQSGSKGTTACLVFPITETASS